MIRAASCVVLVLALTGQTPPVSASGGLAGLEPGVDYVPGELLVRFAGAESAADLEALSRRLGGELAASVPQLDFHLVRVSGELGESLERFERHPQVLQVAPNTLYPLLDLPNDTRFGEQWALQNLGQTGGELDADIDAPRAWAITTGDAGVVIGIIDSGVNYEHPDLDGGRYLGGWDYFANDSDPMDETGHGTHVAGIATADTNNAIGMAGVSRESGYLALRACSIAGCSTLAVALSATWAADNGADVINLSLGGPGPNPFLEEAVVYAYQNGVVPVCAAGNHDDTVAFPAAYGECIAVAASDHFDERASFSSTGPELDVAAPGDDILSTEHSFYLLKSGTSMSAPHVTGLVALLLAQRPEMTIEEVRAQLRGTTDGEGFDVELGHGRINAEKALATWLEPAPVRDLGVATLLDCDPIGLPDLDASATQFCREHGFDTFAAYQIEGPVGGIHTWWDGKRWKTSGNNAVCFVNDLECKLPISVALGDCQPCGVNQFCVTGSATGGELPLEPYWRKVGGPWVRGQDPGEGSWDRVFSSPAPNLDVEFKVFDAAAVESDVATRVCGPS